MRQCCLHNGRCLLAMPQRCVIATPRVRTACKVTLHIPDPTATNRTADVDPAK